MDALRQTPGVTGAAFASQLPAGPLLRRHPHLRRGPAARMPLGQRVCLRRGHTGLLFDDADPAPRRPAAERVRQPATRCADRRDQRSRRARVLARSAIRSAPRRASAHPTTTRFEVVGVVGDVRNNGLNRPAVPEIYLPAAAWA